MSGQLKCQAGSCNTPICQARCHIFSNSAIGLLIASPYLPPPSPSRRLFALRSTDPAMLHVAEVEMQFATETAGRTPTPLQRFADSEASDLSRFAGKLPDRRVFRPWLTQCLSRTRSFVAPR